MSKPRTFKLGTVEGGAKDGGDVFAVISCNSPISFKEMIDGVKVIDISAYDELVAQYLELYRLYKGGKHD